MRRLSVALPAVMGVVCGVYSIIYLVRWEWNRAIIAALFFVAVEVVVGTMVVLDRLRRIDARLDALAAAPPAMPTAVPDVAPALAAIRDGAPPPSDHFRWLRDHATRTGVFLPVLLGAGVLASALAWAVEHVARATLTPVRERRLADGLGAIRPPIGGLLAAPVDGQPSGEHPLRRALVGLAVAAALVAGAAGTVGAVDFVADRTQTRPDPHVAGTTTVVELELLGAIATANPTRVLDHLWATCTGPDVFRLRTLPPADVHHGGGTTVRVRVDAHVGEHAMARLRGCLNDTTLDRVQARVVRTATTGAG